MNTNMTTKEKIVELGRDFVQQLGYHAFTYQLIAKELDIKNAAIHHYFPAKEDLGVAIVEKDLSDFQHLVQAASKSPVREKAEALLGVYSSYFRAGKNLCVVGACISAYAEVPERMGIVAKHYQDMIYQWLVAVFTEGLANGEFHFTERPEDLAALWIATLPGVLQAAQARGGQYFEQVLDQLRKSLH
jgi:TetR/AcrR family transcriptional repressor of nem operon